MSFNPIALNGESSTVDMTLTLEYTAASSPHDAHQGNDFTDFLKALNGDLCGQPQANAPVNHGTEHSNSTPCNDNAFTNNLATNNVATTAFGVTNPAAATSGPADNCRGEGSAPTKRSLPHDPTNAEALVSQLLQMVSQLIEMLKGSDASKPGGIPSIPEVIQHPQPQNPPTDKPPLNADKRNNKPILNNTINGGSGKRQRDMDASTPGTQINVVLDSRMNQADRVKSLQALQRWEDASNGKLDFNVYESGQQPGGQDYTVMRAVRPDNTNQAGVADVGRSPDGVTELEFESGASLGIVMHEIGHTLGFRHGDGVLKAVNASDKFSEKNLADLAALYPKTSNAIA